MIVKSVTRLLAQLVISFGKIRWLRLLPRLSILICASLPAFFSSNILFVCSPVDRCAAVMKLELPNANPIAFEHSLHFLVQILVLSARASYLFRISKATFLLLQFFKVKCVRWFINQLLHYAMIRIITQYSYAMHSATTCSSLVWQCIRQFYWAKSNLMQNY